MLWTIVLIILILALVGGGIGPWGAAPGPPVSPGPVVGAPVPAAGWYHGYGYGWGLGAPLGLVVLILIVLLALGHV